MMYSTKVVQTPQSKVVWRTVPTSGWMGRSDPGNKQAFADDYRMTSDVSEGEQLRRASNKNVESANTLLATANDEGAGVTFDVYGLEWLDGYLDAARASGDQARYNQAYWMGGAFYGECLIRSLGGYWHDRNGLQAVVFDEDNTTLPFEAVLNRLDGEVGASTAGAFMDARAEFGRWVDAEGIRIGATRRRWGQLVAVNDEAVRNFHPRSGTAEQILAAAFAIVRNGDARAVTISLDQCDGVDPDDLCDAYESTWAELVAANDESTRCRYTDDAVVKIDVTQGDQPLVTLVSQPSETPSVKGRDAGRL